MHINNFVLPFYFGQNCPLLYSENFIFYFGQNCPLYNQKTLLFFALETLDRSFPVQFENM